MRYNWDQMGIWAAETGRKILLVAFDVECYVASRPSLAVLAVTTFSDALVQGNWLWQCRKVTRCRSCNGRRCVRLIRVQQSSHDQRKPLQHWLTWSRYMFKPKTKNKQKSCTICKSWKSETSRNESRVKSCPRFKNGDTHNIKDSVPSLEILCWFWLLFLTSHITNEEVRDTTKEVQDIINEVHDIIKDIIEEVQHIIKDIFEEIHDIIKHISGRFATY